MLPLCGIAAMATPYVRTPLEQFMLSHVLVQIPLLVLAGVWFGYTLTNGRFVVLPYHFALPLLVSCFIIAVVWMLPRVLDAALVLPLFVLFKFLSLPFLLGLVLPYAWKGVGPITRTFFATNMISMAMVLAWLYIKAPVRLCNNYLLGEQRLLGTVLLVIVATVSLWWISTVLFRASR